MLCLRREQRLMVFSAELSNDGIAELLEQVGKTQAHAARLPEVVPGQIADVGAAQVQHQGLGWGCFATVPSTTVAVLILGTERDRVLKGHQFEAALSKA